MSTFNSDGTLDLGDGRIIVCQGKKRSGKSIMGLMIFQSFPYDRLVVDVAGDDGPMGDGVHTLTGHVGELPDRWPEHLRDDPKKMLTLRYAPDAGSSTFAEDVDAVIGLAFRHSSKERPVCVLVHEMGVVAKANQTQPHMRRLLMHNRHQHATLIACMPRSVNVEPLVLAQADLVYSFELPSKSDRERTADTIGWDMLDSTAAVRDLRPHGYLRFDANQAKPESDDQPDHRLVDFPPLPPEVVRDVKAWAHGRR